MKMNSQIQILIVLNGGLGDFRFEVGRECRFGHTVTKIEYLGNIGHYRVSLDNDTNMEITVTNTITI